MHEDYILPLACPLRRSGQLDNELPHGAAKFYSHDRRPTYNSGLLDNDVDIGAAAFLAGHASVETGRI